MANTMIASLRCWHEDMPILRRCVRDLYSEIGERDATTLRYRTFAVSINQVATCETWLLSGPSSVSETVVVAEVPASSAVPPAGRRKARRVVA